eukprot:m.185571 g.185571  ORF g.185571 m.185571 type:complete len:539 (-) comp16685_c3_seq2:923-2539(-)
MARLSVAFTIKLGYEVQPGCVTVGLLDGVHPSLVCAAPGGKVVVHSPQHARSNPYPPGRAAAKRREDTTVLRFNREVTRLSCGQLITSTSSRSQATPDLIFVGSSDNLTAYDFVNNSDKFSIDAADGCSALAIGTLGDQSQPLIFVGGTCSIYGYDHEGNDQFWTVTGDDVTALAIGPFTSGENQLVVGSEDFDIRVFNADAELLMELSERDAITQLVRLSGQRYAFTLANGIVGVYQSKQLLWSHKSKHQATAIIGYDVNFDGVPELVVGWADGKIDIFDPATGDIITSQSMKTAIAGFVVSDYRMEGKQALIAVAIDGRVSGFQVGAKESLLLTKTPVIQEDLSAKLRLLQQKKKDLQYRLNTLQQSAAQAQRATDQEKTMLTTDIHTSLTVEDERVVLNVATTTGVPIRSVILFAEGLFEGESHVMHCEDPQLSKLSISLLPPKLEAFDVSVKVLAGPHTGYVSTTYPTVGEPAPIAVGPRTSPHARLRVLRQKFCNVDIYLCMHSLSSYCYVFFFLLWFSLSFEHGYQGEIHCM